MSSIKGDDDYGEMNSTEEILGSFIISCSDGTVLLEFGKEVLDEKTGFIAMLIVCHRREITYSAGNDGLTVLGKEQPTHSLGMIGFVREECCCGRKISDQGVTSCHIMAVSLGKIKLSGIAQRITHRMDFST